MNPRPHVQDDVQEVHAAKIDSMNERMKKMLEEEAELQSELQYMIVMFLKWTLLNHL